MRAKSPSPSSIRSALLQVCRASPCSWLRLVMDGAGRPGCSVPSPICWRISAARCRAPYGNGPGPGGSAERRLWNALDSLADLRQQTERLSHAHPVAPRADPAALPRPRVRTRPARRPARAERRRTGRPGCAAARHPDNGTKRARIGKASGYTHRSFCPDAVHHMYVHTATHRPTVTHPDTRRDKKETARRAAFPQRAGRFRRWWQVLGSNQRRLSRRFYRPLPLATRATCRVPQCWRLREG